MWKQNLIIVKATCIKSTHAISRICILLLRMWITGVETARSVAIAHRSRDTAPPSWLCSERQTCDLVVLNLYDTRLWQTFFLVYFRLSPLLKHVRQEDHDDPISLT